MRVVTWNMNACFRSVEQRRSAWESLDPTWPYGFDVALVQEATEPPMREPDDDDWVFARCETAKPGSEWGTGIYEPTGRLSAVELPRASHDGGAIVAQLPVSGAADLTLISVYGVLEKFLGTEWSIPSLHRTISDLTPILADPQRRGRIILAGDFNANVRWDKGTKLSTPGSHSLLFDRLEAFGLRCLMPAYRDQEQPVVTFKTRGQWLLDYIFVSNELVAHAGEPEAVFADEHSDHAAVRVDIDVPGWRQLHPRFGDAIGSIEDGA